MKHFIRIDSGKNTGSISGAIDDYYWYANVSENKSPKGLGSNFLNRTGGYISKLVIYNLEDGITGNPNLPSISTKRTIFVNYNEKWLVFNKEFETMVLELTEYLERRVKISVVKE